MRVDELNEPEEQNETSDEGADGLDPTFVTEGRKPMSRGAIGAFGLLLACGAATYFMYLRHGPQSASAATPESVAAASTINEFLTSSGGNAKLMKQTLQDTEKVVQEFVTYPGKSQIPLAELKTNPFRLTAVAPKTNDDNDSAARRRREEERREVLKIVQGLQLQSVMHGGKRKTCMINNTLYEEGQDLDGFIVEQITPKTVIVQKGMYRFELRMTR